MNDQCACGMSYVRGHAQDEEGHTAYHNDYARGPLIEPLTTLPSEPLANYQVVWVDSTVDPAIRRAAARVAYVECLEVHRPTAYDGSDTDERPRLVIALLNRRAVGMVMLGNSDMHWRLRWEPNGVVAVGSDRIPPRIQEQRTGIGRVWIAADYRGQRLGTELVLYAAKRTAVDIRNMVWTIPLTQGGERLVRSLCPQEWLADGSWDDLLDTLGEEDD